MWFVSGHTCRCKVFRSSSGHKRVLSGRSVSVQCVACAFASHVVAVCLFVWCSGDRPSVGMKQRKTKITSRKLSKQKRPRLICPTDRKIRKRNISKNKKQKNHAMLNMCPDTSHGS